MAKLGWLLALQATGAGDDEFPDVAGGGVLGLFFMLVLLGISVFIIIASVWMVFAKAGKPGWASIVPIYNVIILLEMAGKPVWWIVLMFIPAVNIVVLVLVALSLANAFGKGGGFAVGLVFLPIIFYPILAFGDAQYKAPAGAAAGA